MHVLISIPILRSVNLSTSTLVELIFISLQKQTTPLHKAALTGRLEVCDLLLKSGADVHCQDQAGPVVVIFC